MTVRVVQVIFSDEATRGKGTEENMVRRILTLHTLDGSLICEHDVGPIGNAPSSEQIVSCDALRKLGRQS